MQIIIAILCAIFLFCLMSAASIVPLAIMAASGIGAFIANRRGHEGLAGFLFGLACLFLVLACIGI